MTTEPLYKIFERIDPAMVTCCAYHKSYLERLQKDAAYYFKIYNHIWEKAEKSIEGKIEDAHLVDFGCGHGIIGIFAKLRGWGKVSLIDMHPHCIDNATKIAHMLEVDNVFFKQGNESVLKEHFAEEGMSAHVLISMDVIEHVYDLSKFIQEIKEAAPNATLIFTTGAIKENPLRSKPMIKLQVADEHLGTDVLQTTPENPYAGLSFIETRRLIIIQADHKQELSTETISLLVKVTRGMNKQDIEKSVAVFLEKGILPEELKHPTNTCDPISSSWTERLLSIQEYHDYFEQGGYTIKIEPGYYNGTTSKGFKKLLLGFMNAIVKIFGSPKIGAYLVITAKI